MPRYRSERKALRKSIQNNHRNRMVKTGLRSLMKKVETGSNPKESRQSMVEAFSVIDKAAKRKIIHANQAARLKSRISRTVNRLEPARKA